MGSNTGATCQGGPLWVPNLSPTRIQQSAIVKGYHAVKPFDGCLCCETKTGPFDLGPNKPWLPTLCMISLHE